MANTAAFARWLRELRESVDPELSQAELARLARCSKNYISRLEAMSEPNAPAPIHNPGEARIDAIVRVLEGYLHRPLVNEGRRVIGYPILADEPAPADQATLSARDQRRIADVATRLMRYTPTKRAMALELLDALDRIEGPKLRAVCSEALAAAG